MPCCPAAAVPRFCQSLMGAHYMSCTWGPGSGGPFLRMPCQSVTRLSPGSTVQLWSPRQPFPGRWLDPVAEDDFRRHPSLFLSAQPENIMISPLCPTTIARVLAFETFNRGLGWFRRMRRWRTIHVNYKECPLGAWLYRTGLEANETDHLATLLHWKTTAAPNLRRHKSPSLLARTDTTPVRPPRAGCDRAVKSSQSTL